MCKEDDISVETTLQPFYERQKLKKYSRWDSNEEILLTCYFKVVVQLHGAEYPNSPFELNVCGCKILKLNMCGL